MLAGGPDVHQKFFKDFSTKHPDIFQLMLHCLSDHDVSTFAEVIESVLEADLQAFKSVVNSFFKADLFVEEPSCALLLGIDRFNHFLSKLFNANREDFVKFLEKIVAKVAKPIRSFSRRVFSGLYQKNEIIFDQMMDAMAESHSETFSRWLDEETSRMTVEEEFLSDPKI